MIADAVQHHLARHWARLCQRLAVALGSTVKIGPPHVLVRRSWLRLLAQLDMFGELSKSAVESFLVRIVVVPLLRGLGPELRIVVLGLIGLSLIVESHVVRSEQILWLVVAEEGLQYLGLVHQSLVALYFLLIVIRSSLVLVRSEEMISIGIAKAFLHVICCNILHPSPHIAVLISSVVGLIVKLLHMLELRVFSTL